MTFKDKIIFALLSIFTLGIYPLIIFSKKTNVENNINITNKVTVDTKTLKMLLGGPDNVIGSEYTTTKVKIFIDNRQLVDIEKIRKLKGISGVVAGSRYVTILVGPSAKALSHSL